VAPVLGQNRCSHSPVMLGRLSLAPTPESLVRRQGPAGWPAEPTAKKV
jgi:hypothetical protein